MSTEREVEALLELVEIIKRLTRPRVKPEEVLTEDYASRIASFINVLWHNLKIPEDLKSKLIEMVLDYVLRAVLRVRPPERRECEDDEEIPRSYVI